MRNFALLTALLWPTMVAAHGDPTDHIHPHGAFVLPYEMLLVLAALTLAVGGAALLRRSGIGERFRRAIGNALRRLDRRG